MVIFFSIHFKHFVFFSNCEKLFYYNFIHRFASFNQLSHCQDPPHTRHHRWSFWSDVVHLLWATSWYKVRGAREVCVFFWLAYFAPFISFCYLVAVQRRCSFTINGLFVLVLAAAACSAPHFHSYEWNSQISLAARLLANQLYLRT